MSTATVYDFNPAQLRRTTNRQTSEAPAAETFSVLDNLADGIEAVHQFANIAKFSERPRAFIFTLATAAHSHGQDQVRLYDEELAELQNCSTRTVQRQRKEYIAEAKRKDFDLVEIVEGEFDKQEGKFEPTLYRFHIGDAVERAVVEAHSIPGWREMKRPKQREAIKQAAKRVWDEIPKSESKGRKKPRPRLATAEIETCQKVAQTKLRRMRELASSLPLGLRQELMNAEDPGQLYHWWIELRTEMDGFFCINDSPQTLDIKEDDRGPRQFVVTPSVTVAVEQEEQHASEPAETVAVNTIDKTTTHAPEDFAAWDQVCDRFRKPQIRRTEVELCPPDPPPVTEDRDEDPPTVVCGPALWCNADNDLSVTVTGDMGIAPDGRRYVSILESKAGVPLDEIRYSPKEFEIEPDYEQYDYELRERIFFKMESGTSEEEARWQALNELGDVDEWSRAQHLQAELNRAGPGRFVY